MSDDQSDRRQTFDALFASDPDPWGFEHSEYEATKRHATLAILFPDRFKRALEIGCANGILTAELATICETVLALDVSSEALQLAARRVGTMGNVSLARAEVPREWPDDTFDLIVFSEILYFLSEDEISQVAQLAWKSLTEEGVCLLVNWTGPNDLPLDGREASEIFTRDLPWLKAADGVWPLYRIDRLHKARGRGEPRAAAGDICDK